MPISGNQSVGAGHIVVEPQKASTAPAAGLASAVRPVLEVVELHESIGRVDHDHADARGYRLALGREDLDSHITLSRKCLREHLGEERMPVDQHADQLLSSNH